MMKYFHLIALTFCCMYSKSLVAQCLGAQRIDASYELDRNDICAGQPVTASNITEEFGNTNAFYIWDWGDGTKDTVMERTSIEHTYNFQDENACTITDGFRSLRLTLEAIIPGCPQFGHFVTKPIFVYVDPVANFSVDRQIRCFPDTEVIFNNTSCTVDETATYMWDFGDPTSGSNNTSTEFEPTHVFSGVGTYQVSLTVMGRCGNETKTETISIIEPPLAVAEAISGTIEGNGTDEPYLVCLGNGGQVILDGRNSQNATQFQWSSRGSGAQWVSDQRNQIDTIQFLTAGNYDITLTVNNACDEESICVHQFRVVEATALSLNDQPDGCNQLEYTPNPFNPDATYRINDEVVTDFPITLEVGEYLIEATLSNECGNQMEPDTFIVAAEQQVNILNSDTTLCSDVLAFEILLSDSLVVGECLIDGVPAADCQFNPASFAGRESVISFQGGCASSNEVRINVIDAGSLSIDLPTTTFCVDDPPFEIPVSDTGGQFVSGRGFGDSTGIYDPALADVGLDTIRYELEFEAVGDAVCPGSDTKVIEIFPPLQVDFQQLTCEGNTVTFDTVQTSMQYTSIEYNFGDGRTSNQESPTHTYSQAGDYEVTVILRQAGGCEAIMTKSITVEPPPVAQFELDFAPDNCSTLEVGINDQSSGNIRSYFWDFGNGQTDTTASPSNVFYEAIGQDATYTLSLTVQNGCSTVTIEEDIFVKAGPNPNFVLDKDLHCSGEEVALQSVLANADDNNDFWFWDYGNGKTSMGKTPEPQIYETMVQDTFLVSLTVGNVCDTMTTTIPVVVIPSDVTAFLNIDKTIGCADQAFRFINESGVPNAEFFFSDNTTAIGDTIVREFSSMVEAEFEVMMRVFGCGYDDTTMTFRVLPSPELELLVDPTACSREAVVVEVNSNVAGITVDFGDGFISDNRLASHVYDSVGVFTIQATAISQSGCVSETTQTVSTLSSPIADYNITTPTICEQNTISFTDQSSGNIVDWKWQFGDGNFSTTASATTNTFVTSGSYPFQLIVEDANGCKDTISDDITVQPLPQLDVATAVPDPCLPNIQFENGTLADGFTWQFDDGSPISTLTNPLHTYPNTGTYAAKLIADLDGCLDSVNLSIVIPEFPVLAATVDQLVACAPSEVIFDATTSSNVDTYRWNFDDGTTSFVAAQNHTFVAPGIYQVVLSATKGDCTIDSTFEVAVGDTLLANIATIEDVACFGASTGSASVEVTSGNAPYSFLWSNELNTNPATDLSAGTYEVTVTDELGCMLTLTTEIAQPMTAISTTALVLIDASCYEATDGILEIAASGGTPPYQYVWQDGITGRMRQNLIAGAYTVTVTDGNNCPFENTFTVAQPDPIVIDFIADPICQDTVGSITVLPSGGTAPYLISDLPTFDQLGDFYPGLTKGLYQFFVQDINGCEATASVELEELPDWQLSIQPNRVEFLKGDSVFIRPFISIDDADFEWQPSEFVRSPNEKDTWVCPLRSTVYQLRVTDEFGCIKTATFSTFVKDTVAVYIPNAFTPFNQSAKANQSDRNDYFTAYSNFPAAERIQQMTITDKYGTIVFDQTNLPLNVEELGWDGTFNGKPLASDEYAYKITIRYIDGEETFTGKVLLIR